MVARSQISCPTCNAKLLAKLSARAKTLPCPKCGNPIDVPSTGTESTTALSAKTKGCELTGESDSRLQDDTSNLSPRRVNTWLIAVGVVGFLVFSLSGHRGWFLLTYPFLLIATVFAGIHFVAGPHKFLKLAVAIVGIVSSLYLHGYFHTYEQRWESKAGSSFRDTYHFWSGKHTYRRISMKDHVNDSRISVDGPIAGTGKPHGKWSYFYWNDLRSDTVFYWYGEEISEGGMVPPQQVNQTA